MNDYISNEQFRELSKEIHLEMILNKFNEVKIDELKQKLTMLKHLRAKSVILEMAESKKEKGL